MEVNLLIFGQLCDVLGDHFTLDNIADTDNLKKMLIENFPEVGNYKYAIAVDKKLVTENVILTGNSTVALLPPFSGG